MVAGEVWWVIFPYDDCDKEKERPAVVAFEYSKEVFAMKCTSHSQRDSQDVPVIYWKEAGLSSPTVVRIDKTIVMSDARFIRRVGKLRPSDWCNLIGSFFEYIMPMDKAGNIRFTRKLERK